MGSFGDKFRKERERRGLSLDDVSNVTKIASRMLKAIEDEHFDQLPGGVFNKGFIRAYARHLGLNDEEAVNEYLEALRQAQVDAQSNWAPAPPMQPRAPESGASKKAAPAKPQAPRPPISPARDETVELPHLQLPKAEHIRSKPPALDGDRAPFPWTIAAAIILVLMLGVFLWNRHGRSARAENGAQPSVPLTSASPNPATAAAATPLTPAPAASNPTPVKSQQAILKSAGTQAASASAPLPAAREQNDVTIRSANPLPSASTTPAKPAPTIRLVIRAEENSWISVIADGQPVIEETLIAPAHTTVRATNEITVKVGNAAGVSFLVNDKEVPAQGAEAEVRSFTFDAQGIRAATISQPTEQPH